MIDIMLIFGLSIILTLWFLKPFEGTKDLSNQSFDPQVMRRLANLENEVAKLHEQNKKERV